ncbi:hypothetical protein NMG60_11018862 [Bertholletia excelsa]
MAYLRLTTTHNHHTSPANHLQPLNTRKASQKPGKAAVVNFLNSGYYIFALFLPCLIFTQLGQSITLNNVTLWWFIPTNVFLSTLVGCMLGFFVVILCRPPPQFTRFTIISTAFGNTGNLQLAVVGCVCHSVYNPFGHDCLRKGMAIISFAQWVSVILVYTVVYHMMEPPMEFYDIVGSDSETAEQEADGHIGPLLYRDDHVSSPLLVEAEWPGIEDEEPEHCKIGLIPDPDDPDRVQCLAEPRIIRKIRIIATRTPIKHVLQPPTIASLLAIIIGMVPQMKALFFRYDAPLSFITDSLRILAGAMVPSVMLVLGGVLAEGPNESKLGVETTIGIIVARLFVLPLIGIGTVTLADRLHLLVPGDDMYKFVLLLQYTTPSVILLGAMASLRNYAVREASALIFWQHLCAVLSLSLNLFICFILLSHV